MPVFGNHGCNLLRHQQQRRAVAALAKQRPGLPAETAHKTIWQNRLQPIPHLEPILALVGRKQDHHAAVFLSGPNPPACGEIDREILDGLTLERFDCHDGDLGLRFVINLSAEGIQILRCFRIDHPREVVDISPGLQILGILCECM